MFPGHHADLHRIEKVNAEGVSDRADDKFSQLPFNIGSERQIRYKPHFQPVYHTLDDLVLTYGG
jgi:hypothetical protein